MWYTLYVVSILNPISSKMYTLLFCPLSVVYVLTYSLHEMRTLWTLDWQADNCGYFLLVDR